MKKTLVLAGSMLALMATIASAQGINLAWDDCGTNGTSTMSSTCSSNSGVPFGLYASFDPPVGVDEFLGISSQIDITSSTPSLPDWWKHGTGQCRTTSGLSITFDFTSGPFACADFYSGQAAGGFAYDIGFSSANRARLRVQAAVPVDNRGPVANGTEYYAFKVNLQRSKSANPGACAGCVEPMCIVLNSVQLFQPLEEGNDPEITNPANSNYVTWQAPVIAGCPLSTPTRNSSWGAVKSLYR